MKAQVHTIKVPVTTYEEKKSVTIEMTYDEAAILFCLLGQTDSGEGARRAEESIERYNPQFKYLLPSIEGRVHNLVHGLHQTLNKTIA